MALRSCLMAVFNQIHAYKMDESPLFVLTEQLNIYILFLFQKWLPSRFWQCFHFLSVPLAWLEKKRDYGSEISPLRDDVFAIRYLGRMESCAIRLFIE